MPTFEAVEKIRRQLSENAHQYWINDNLFTWQWWLLIILSIVPWFIWWKFVDKEKLIEIALYGAFISMIASVLDVIGTNTVLWGYPHQPLWFLIPPLLPIDLTIMPVEHMLIYQYFPRWKGFVLTLLIVAVVSALMIEPLFNWAGIYILYSWKYVYSIPIYIAIAVVAKVIIQKLLQYQKPSH
jgi:hypothetical protein